MQHFCCISNFMNAVIILGKSLVEKNLVWFFQRRWHGYETGKNNILSTGIFGSHPQAQPKPNVGLAVGLAFLLQSTGGEGSVPDAPTASRRALPLALALSPDGGEGNVIWGMTTRGGGQPA
jgi:hypothetical protein